MVPRISFRSWCVILVFRPFFLSVDRYPAHPTVFELALPPRGTDASSAGIKLPQRGTTAL